MPRINDIMQLPPGSYGAPNTSIKSAPYNTVLDDLVNDANNPRPISAGGTGEQTPEAALAALGANNANNLTAGTLPSERLSGSYTSLTGTGALDAGSITSGFGDIDIGTSKFTGDGSQLTNLPFNNLNASNLTSGTVPAARLSGVYAFGSLLLSDTGATGLLVERLGSAINSVAEFKTTAGSVFAGQGIAGAFTIGASSSLSGLANRWAQFTPSEATFYGNVVVSGGIDAGSSEIKGNLTHVSNYFLINAYSASYGEGALRWYWNATSRTLVTSVLGDGSGVASIANMNLEGNADTATTATNCSRSILPGSGLTGGGALTANRTLTLGTPGSISNDSTNSVSASSHTHALAVLMAEVYTGSTQDLTNYPVGTMLIVRQTSGNPPGRNGTQSFGLSEDARGFDSLFSNVSGTWRSRGSSAGTNIFRLVQRTA